MMFRNSEWGPESNEAMYKEFENFPAPWGGTMGEIMKDTPKDRISKVFLEEKLFKTWYDGQTVLLGDGKLNHPAKVHRRMISRPSTIELISPLLVHVWCHCSGNTWQHVIR